MKKIKNNLARFLAMVILFSFAQSQGKNDKDTINPTNAINYVGKVKTVCIFYFSANYTKLHNNVGVSFINKRAPRLGEALCLQCSVHTTSIRPSFVS
jgi:hypothetical protein